MSKQHAKQIHYEKTRESIKCLKCMSQVHKIIKRFFYSERPSNIFNKKNQMVFVNSAQLYYISDPMNFVCEYE